MIEQARQNVPAAEFIQGDITDFELGRHFDVVTCLFDTINHIQTASGWERVFSRAADHLKPEGIFIFDMVTERLLKDIVKLDVYSWKFEGGKCSFDMQPMSDSQYRGNFKIVAGNDKEKITELSIVETTFPVVPVLRSLKKVLDPKIVFDHDAALTRESNTWPRATEQTGRIMVVSSKSAKLPKPSAYS